VGRMRMKEELTHRMALQYVNILQDYMGHTGFEYGDISAARLIHTEARSPNISKNKGPLQTISQINVGCIKREKWKIICDFCGCSKQNILDYLFLIIRAPSPHHKPF
jgi:hypothetical protein